MYILHIETSTKICSVALSRDEELVECLERTEGMNHTALLAPMISQLLKSASLKPGDLGAISVSSGPGSYTGLRVGGSTAKAMAYSLNIPLVSIPTLVSLAWAGFHGYPAADYVMPMVDARRNEVYISLFDPEGNEIFPTSSLILEQGSLSFIPEKKTVVCCGDGAFKLDALGLNTADMIINVDLVASARNLISPAFRLLSAKIFSDPMHFVPDYLKPPNITQDRRGQ
ncbi:MAG: tRNA (adenosine(37)-N6)-threonylcarbamoyltransferase complex dimerization subunit type 1 TsaB [Saprospiraceae bacterium]